MTKNTLIQRASRSVIDRRDAALFVGLFFLCIFIRLAVSAPLLDQFQNYSRPGGSPLEKIHPATFGVLFLFVIIFLTQVWPSDRRDNRVARASVLFLVSESCVVAIGTLVGSTTAFSYILDSVIQGPVAAITLMYLDRSSRATLFKLLIGFLVINNLILFYEFATSTRLVPADWTVVGAYTVFRPTALLGHPLMNGLLNATMVAFVWLLPWPPMRRLALSFFFLVAAFAATARMASLLGSLAFLGAVWLYLRQARRENILGEGVVTAAMVGAGFIFSVAVVVLVGAGFADRFMDLGLNDESAQSRFQVYSMLDYLSAKQVLFGATFDEQQYILQNILLMTNNESPIMGFIAQFGIIGMALIVPALLYYLFTLARNGGSAYIYLGVLIFAAVASTNNTFVSKGPALTFITMLSLSAAAMVDSRRRGRTAAKVAPARVAMAPG